MLGTLVHPQTRHLRGNGSLCFKEADARGVSMPMGKFVDFRLELANEVGINGLECSDLEVPMLHLSFHFGLYSLIVSQEWALSTRSWVGGLLLLQSNTILVC